MSLARLDLAAARLGLGHLEGACEQIREVLAASSRRRTFAVNRRLHYLAAVLSSPTFSRTPLAAEARDEIEAFNAVSLVPALPARSRR